MSAKLSKIGRVNNPLIHDLNTLDCTSCHQATAAEAAVNVLAPDVKADDAKARPTSRFNLSNEATRALFDPRKTERLHFVLQMLSYRGAAII